MSQLNFDAYKKNVLPGNTRPPGAYTPKILLYKKFSLAFIRIHLKKRPGQESGMAGQISDSLTRGEVTLYPGPAITASDFQARFNNVQVVAVVVIAAVTIAVQPVKKGFQVDI